jgi:hypothetical protein
MNPVGMRKTEFLADWTMAPWFQHVPLSLCLAGHATFPAAKIGEDKLVFFQNRMLTQARFVLGIFQLPRTNLQQSTDLSDFEILIDFNWIFKL